MGLIRIDVAPELIAHILENGDHPRGFTVTGGLPEAATFDHAELDMHGFVRLYYRHPSVSAGAATVQLTPIIHTL